MGRTSEYPSNYLVLKLLYKLNFHPNLNFLGPVGSQSARSYTRKVANSIHPYSSSSSSSSFSFSFSSREMLSFSPLRYNILCLNDETADVAVHSGRSVEERRTRFA